MVKSCCCFDLKTGCMYIGTGDIVLSIILIISGLVGLSNGTIDSGKGTSMIVGAVLSILAAVYLIRGVNDDKPGYLMFWIVLKGIAIVVFCILLILLIIAISAFVAVVKKAGLAGPEIETAVVELVISIILFTLFIALNFYSWSVVRSYREELLLKLRRNQENQQMPAATFNNSNLGWNLSQTA